MANFNPFTSDNEDTSFEMGLPANQTAKNVTKAVSDQAAAQSKATQKALMDQLYGPSDNTDNADQQTSDASKQLGQAGHGQQAAAQQAAQSAGNGAHSPDEQATLAKIRRELFAKTHGGQFGIEQQMEKARREREQKEQQRKQQEEEEQQQKEAQQRQMEEGGSLLPAGKKTGMTMGKKQQQPVALTQAKTKTEINRGASG